MPQMLHIKFGMEGTCLSDFLQAFLADANPDFLDLALRHVQSSLVRWLQGSDLNR